MNARNLNDSPKLLIISSEFPPGPGGIGNHAYHLAKQLMRLDWAVHVLSPQNYASEESIRRFNSEQPFPVFNLSSTASASSLQNAIYRFKSLRSMVKTWKPDVIIGSGERVSWLLAAHSYINPIPWLAVWHGNTPITKWEMRVNQWAFERARMVVSVSQYSLQHLVHLGVRPRESIIITNGADTELFHPLESPKIGDVNLPSGIDKCPLLLTVGHVSERKGQDIVIRALPTVLKTVPDVQYIIAGLPTLRERIENLARELGVMEHVHLIGQVPLEQLPMLYNICDVFVLTSRHSRDGEFEGYGIGAVEAALCGKPSVVSGNSGLQEAIVDGKTGFVVQENDPEDTAKAIIRLLTDKQLRCEMGSLARRRALNEQTWEITAAKFDQALRQLL